MPEEQSQISEEVLGVPTNEESDAEAHYITTKQKGVGRKARERGDCRNEASDRRCPQGCGELRTLDDCRDAVRGLCGKSRGGRRRSTARWNVEQSGLDPKADLKEVNHGSRNSTLVAGRSHPHHHPPRPFHAMRLCGPAAV